MEEDNKTITLRFRCTPEEAEKMRQLAKDAGMTLSEYIRCKLIYNK